MKPQAGRFLAFQFFCHWHSSSPLAFLSFSRSGFLLLQSALHLSIALSPQQISGRELSFTTYRMLCASPNTVLGLCWTVRSALKPYFMNFSYFFSSFFICECCGLWQPPLYRAVWCPGIGFLQLAPEQLCALLSPSLQSLGTHSSIPANFSDRGHSASTISKLLIFKNPSSHAIDTTKLFFLNHFWF